MAIYVSACKKEIYEGQAEGYLPLEHHPGEAQVDFGAAQFYERGKLIDGKYLSVAFPYSNQGYLQLFYGENMECLLEGLVSIFRHIGGVPSKLWFDNMRTVVAKIIKGGGREINDRFLRFMSHYGFSASFCNPDAGHEKGCVENKVGYHRRNLLVPIPEIQSLTEYNEVLLLECDQNAEREHYRCNKTIKERFEKDKDALLPFPSNEFDTAGYKHLVANGYGKIYLNKGLHEYSAAPRYARKTVTVKVTAGEVIVQNESGREIVRHRRLYGDTKQQSMDWLPYLYALSQRPKALKYSGIYHMMPEEVKTYIEKQTRKDTGKILKVLATITEKSSFDNAIAAVQQAISYEAYDADSLIATVRRLYADIAELPALSVNKDKLLALCPISVNLKAYDLALLEQGGRPHV